MNDVPERSSAGRQPSGTPRRTLLTVSGVIPADLATEVELGRRPRSDYVVLAEAMGADLVDYGEVRSRQGKIGRALDRLAGPNAALAWDCFKRRRDYDAIVTDGEQVGIPLAMLMKLQRRSRRPRHVMIVHILSVRKKALMFRLLRLRSGVDRFVVYCSAQRRFIIDRFGASPAAVVLHAFMVDTDFFDPAQVTQVPRVRPTICAAGLECRDYPTLLAAVDGLDADVVIAAASPWSKRSSGLDETPLPSNVSVVRLGLFELRQLYADASLVVMPLQPVMFQAGITTILEAMSMAKVVVCTATDGQDDTIVDGETGRYVPQSDPAALRRVVEQLLEDPAELDRLGRSARQWAVERADIDVYAEDFAAIVRSSL